MLGYEPFPALRLGSLVELTAVADSLFGNNPWHLDHANVPSAVFSEPEIGTVGLSEAAAKAAGKSLDIYRTRFKPMKSAFAGSEERCLMKLVVDPGTEKILGCHVVGPDGPEIIQMAAIALKMGVTKPQWDSTCAVHPTLAEELVTMREKYTPPSLGQAA